MEGFSTAAFKSLVDEWQLKGLPTTVVLSTEDYQLFRIEAPKVEADEMKEALRWRLQELVQTPAESLVIDYIELPADAYHGRQHMLYAVVIDRARMQQLEQQVNQTGLLLDSIDIPELALLNLYRLTNESGSNNEAWLYLTARKSLINIVAEEALYFTRRMDLQTDLQADHALLEIRRSLDYYQSQIGRPPCIKLWVSPLQAGETPFMSQLKQELGITVEPLDLADWVDADSPLSPSLQQQALLAIAGALREESGS